MVVFDREMYHNVLNDDDRDPITTWNEARLVSAFDRWIGAPDDWILIWLMRIKIFSLLEQAQAVDPNPK